MDPEQSFGRRWGGYLGSKLGEYAGGALHGLVSNITGLGDYKIRKNVLSGRLPEVANVSSGGGTVIRFQEYLGDVLTASTANTFKIDSYLINAANPKTFPFLAQIAANYDQYEIEGLLFEFRSTSGNALTSTNTALGSVMMATQYDVKDPVFTSKIEMLNYEFSTSCAPSGNCIHMIECDPHQTPVSLLYSLATEDTPANTDARLYHLGRFQIATTGFQGTNVNIGEIHVTYQVKLLKPKLVMALNQDIGTFLLTTDAYGNTEPMGSGTVTTRYDSIGIAYDPDNDNLSFPMSSVPKFYLVNLMWVGSLVAVTHPLMTFTYCTATSYGTASTQMVFPPNGQSSSRASQIFIVETEANSIGFPTITFGVAGTLPSSGASFSINITEINPFTL